MQLTQLINTIKRHRITVVVTAIGTALAFVATFGKSVKEICTLLTVCRPESPISPVAQLAIGQSRAFVEQTSLLGPPKYMYAKSANPDLDPEFELESDERELGSEMFEAVLSKKFNDAGAYYKSKYEYSTYSKGALNYIVRYRKQSQDVSAILLEAITKPGTCADDLRKLPTLQDVLANDKPLCIGETSFGELLGRDGGLIRMPRSVQFVPARCWGTISSGGATGRGAGIQLTCTRSKQSMAEPELSYLLRFVSVGADVPIKFYSFDDEKKPEGRLLDEFITYAKSFKITHMAIFDPNQSK